MNIVETAIGWLAPPVCVGCCAEGETLCLGCSLSGIVPFGERCYSCNVLSIKGRTCEKCRSIGSPHFVWITTDYEGLAKDLVQKFKYSQQRVASRAIARLMTDTFLSFNTEGDITSSNYLIVPIPTATSRVRERSFDHSALLAKTVARKLNLQSANVLMRLGQSRQVGTTRAKRIEQAKGNHIVSKPRVVAGRNILLIDDVVTTGATISASARSLRKAGAKRVDALVFAKRL